MRALQLPLAILLFIAVIVPLHTLSVYAAMILASALMTP
jgi:hypothetical protein